MTEHLNGRSQEKYIYIKGEMKSESTNTIYSITCMKCLEQFVGSAIKFKSKFRIHKSDTKTEIDRWGTARHFDNQCCHSSNLFVYLRVQLIEKVYLLPLLWLKIFYGAEKNIGSPNYLQKWKVWTVFLIYTLLVFQGITFLRILEVSR